MTKLFEALMVIGDSVSDEHRVVLLLASLPDSYDMLVTALEAKSETVPNMEIITERLLHEERKIKEKEAGYKYSGRKVSENREPLGFREPKEAATVTCANTVRSLATLSELAGNSRQPNGKEMTSRRAKRSTQRGPLLQRSRYLAQQAMTKPW